MPQRGSEIVGELVTAFAVIRFASCNLKTYSRKNKVTLFVMIN
jgi:hypothetical protein